MSQVKKVWITPDAEKIIAYCARVSSPNQDNPEYSKLIKYLIDHKHWSPLEMASLCVEIKTARAISPQLLRHKSFSFQEFCLSGDSKITCGYYNSKGKFIPFYIPIKKLFERQKWKNYKDILLRVYDETNKEFVTANFKEVFKTGNKECFRITFEDGKSLVTTKEHKFLTQDGFESLEKALGLKLINNTVVMESPKKLGTNGIFVYQSYEWMKNAKEKCIKQKTGLMGIALDAGVSKHTIKKWLKKLNLSFSNLEKTAVTTTWNKGKVGYKVKPRTNEQKEYMSLITPKGEKHHSYKGGSHSKRKAIANYFNKYRSQLFKDFNYQCQMCFKSFNNYDGKIDLHHIKEVSLYPELALDIKNIIPVHRKCHMEHHGKTYDYKEIRKGHKGNKLAPKFQKVSKIEYMGVIETYDLEVDHVSHNYVANKICVHNSQRYSEANSFDIFDARRQDVKNKQNSIDDLDDETQAWFHDAQSQITLLSNKLYKEALDKNIAKESARFLLPLNTESKLYMCGNIRSFIHYVEVRTDKSTQLEHREIAEEIKKILIQELPNVAKAMNWITN